MEQTDTVLLFLMEGGSVMASEGRLDEFRGLDKDNSGFSFSTVLFYQALHPITNQMYLINVNKIVSVQEVSRESVKLGPNKVVLPGGRIN